MTNALTALFRSRKFLLLVFALITNIVFYFLPSFPTTIWTALDAVVVAIILGIAIEDAAEKHANPYPPEKTAPTPPAAIGFTNNGRDTQ